ncbi:MAG TPA: extracellular solute-binding protein [Anaerolineae bacterium]
MNVPRRVLTQISLTLLTAIVAAACAAPATTAPQATTAPAAPAATVAPAAKAAGPELTMWTWKVFHVPGLEAVAKNFEQKEGIKVKITAFNPDEVYRTKITTSAQSGDLPDILSYWSGGQWELAATDQLVELTSQIDAAWKGNFLAGTFEKSSTLTQDKFDTCQKDPKCTYKNVKVGQSFSVPYLAGQAFFVYANKELLTKAGLDPNKAPTTAEDWLDMMKTVKAKTGTPGLVTGVQNPDVLAFWLFNPLLMTSCGADKYDAIYNGNLTFSDPCALKVLNWMNSIQTNDLWMPNILQTNIDPADVAFSQGKAAFDIGGTYTLGFLVSQGMKPDNLLSFAIPPLKGSTYDKLQVSAFALIDTMVTKNSKHQAEALKFIQFLTTPDQMAVFAKTVGDFPAVKVPLDANKIGPVLVGLMSAFSDKSPFDTSKAQTLDEPKKVLELGLQQFITKETTPDDLVKKIDAANKAAWDARGGPLK